MAMGQTTEIVKDYYAFEKGFGVMPNDIVSSSSIMFFSGTEAMRDMGFRGKYYFYDAFVTDGTTANFTNLDVNVGQELGQQSAPKNAFVINDEIYFIANNGTAEGIYKVSNATGTYSLVTDSWIPGSKPKTHVFEDGKAVFTGVNPADATDTKKYLLEWNGDAGTTPSIINGHSGMYDMNPSGSFGSISAAGATYYVMAAKDPNDVNDVYQLCAVYYDRRSWGDKAHFTKLGADKTKSDYPANFTAIGSIVYFDDGAGKIWEVDFLSSPAAFEVADISSAVSTNGNTTKVMGAFGNKLVFSAYASGETTFSIFTYDKASATVTKLNDGFEIRNLSNAIEVGGKLYFEGQYNSIPYDYNAKVTPLWCYDGTTLSQLATDLSPVSNIHGFNDKVYFSAEDTDGAFLADGTTPASTLNEMFVYDPNGTATAINRFVDENEISVSPNPSFGYVNVSGVEMQNAAYAIYNLAGNLVEKGKVNNNVIDYGVQPGVYLLKIIDGSKTKITKIVVK